MSNSISSSPLRIFYQPQGVCGYVTVYLMLTSQAGEISTEQAKRESLIMSELLRVYQSGATRVVLLEEIGY